MRNIRRATFTFYFQERGRRREEKIFHFISGGAFHFFATSSCCCLARKKGDGAASNSSDDAVAAAASSPDPMATRQNSCVVPIPIGDGGRVVVVRGPLGRESIACACKSGAIWRRNVLAPLQHSGSAQHFGAPQRIGADERERAWLKRADALLRVRRRTGQTSCISLDHPAVCGCNGVGEQILRKTTSST